MQYSQIIYTAFNSSSHRTNDISWYKRTLHFITNVIGLTSLQDLRIYIFTIFIFQSLIKITICIFLSILLYDIDICHEITTIIR